MGNLAKPSLKATIIALFTLSLTLCSGFSAMALGVALGYASNDTELKAGMVVQLSDDSSGADSLVERGSRENQEKIIGLATNPDEPSIVIASGNQRIYVQTDGEAMAYVSDINGKVSKGDQLTISPLRGILMRTTSTSGDIKFGTALEDFPAAQAVTYTINGGESNVDSVLVAKVRINLDAGAFAKGEDGKADSALSQLGVSLTGRNVGEIRVLVALLIFLVMLVAEGGIIYGAISSSITALGRNPLASKIIKHELIRVLIIATFVLGVGLFAIYGVLWL